MTNKEGAEQIYHLIESLYTHVTDLFSQQNSMMQSMNSEVRTDMVNMETALRNDMANMETRLRTEMADMETRLRTEMADMKTELKEAINENGRAIKLLERESKKNAETLFRHDLDIQMLKKTFVETG